MSIAKPSCRNCGRKPRRCVCAYDAIRAALKLIPRGRVRTDLLRVADLLNWRKHPHNSHADSGSVLVRIPRQGPVSIKHS